MRRTRVAGSLTFSPREHAVQCDFAVDLLASLQPRATIQTSRVRRKGGCSIARQDSVSSLRPSVVLVAHGIHDGGGMERAAAEAVRANHGLFRITVVAAELASDLEPLVDRWVKIRVPRRPIPVKALWFYLAAGLRVSRLRSDVVSLVGALVPNRADVISVHYLHTAHVAESGHWTSSTQSPLRRMNTAAHRSFALLCERWSYRRSRTGMLAAVSTGTADDVRAFFPDVPVNLTPNGIDHSRFYPNASTRDELREREGVAETDVIVLFVGGDWSRKGLDLVIDALAASAVQVSLRLWVVGEGDETRYIERASRQGIGEQVRFFGFQIDTSAFYQSADIFVLPSDYETFSLATYEAAACGVPVVTADVHGARDVVAAGGGILVDREVGSVSQALQSLGADADLRKRAGECGRVFAADFTWARSAEALGVLWAHRVNEVRSA